MGVRTLAQRTNITLNLANTTQTIDQLGNCIYDYTHKSEIHTNPLDTESAFNITIPEFLRAVIIAQLEAAAAASNQTGLVINLSKILTDPVIDNIFDALYSPDAVGAGLRFESEIQGKGFLFPFLKF